MTKVNIQIEKGDQTYQVGDSISGIALVTLPIAIPTTDVLISFHCVGKVKWTEFSGSPYDMTGYDYYDTFDYHQEELQILPDGNNLSNLNYVNN